MARSTSLSHTALLKLILHLMKAAEEISFQVVSETPRWNAPARLTLNLLGTHLVEAADVSRDLARLAPLQARKATHEYG